MEKIYLGIKPEPSACCFAALLLNYAGSPKNLSKRILNHNVFLVNLLIDCLCLI